MWKKDRAMVAFLSEAQLPEDQGKTPKTFTAGEVVAFIQAAQPEELHRYATHIVYGTAFKRNMERAYKEYQENRS